MEDYIKFDVVAFLKDSVNWKKQINKLESEIENLIGVSGYIPGERVQTNKLSDKTQETAVKVIEIRETIDNIKAKENILKSAISALTREEKDVIDVFFFSKGKMMGAMVDEFSISHGISVSGVYSLRREALCKLENEILEMI